MVTAITGHCSKCGKIWTLEAGKGVCHWCGKQASCFTGASPRAIKTRTRRRPEPTIANYEGLNGRWLTFYNVASRYEGKIPAQDRDDFRHDTMLELERATKRDGKPLPELRAYRIASLMVALYYRNLNRWATKLCIVNGYPIVPKCKTCQDKTGKPCVWLAVRPVAILENEVVDNEGYRTSLLDTVASADIRDMPDKWYDQNELLNGLPLRLVEIARKRLDGIPLEPKDKMYLQRYWKSHQKRLF